MRRRFHLHQSTTAAKVLEASVSLRWPGGSLEGERQGCALCCAPQPQGPKLSWALISAVQLRSDGWEPPRGWTVFHLPSTPGVATPPPRAAAFRPLPAANRLLVASHMS